MKKLVAFLFILAYAVTALRAQDGTVGSIKATVLDEKGQPMPGAVVVILSSGSKIGGQSDMDGNVSLRALTPGSYDVQARMIGYKVFTKKAVIVSAGQTAYTSFPMQLVDTSNIEIVIRDVKSPVDPQYSTLQNINADQIKHIAADRTDIVSVVTGSSSQVSQGKGGQLVMRGAREGASQMYVDGEVLYGNIGVPAGSIEQVTILSGGIPAAYGDVTGGIVIVTTKSYWTGMNAKQSWLDAVAEEEAAARKAALEASGEHSENGTQIIENGNSGTPANTNGNGGTTDGSSGTDVQPK